MQTRGISTMAVAVLLLVGCARTPAVTRSAAPPPTDRERLEQELTELRREVAAARSELAMLRDQLAGERRDLQQLTSERDRIRSEIAKLQQDKTALERALGSLRADVAALEARKTTLQSEVRALESSKQSLAREIEVQERALAGLRAEVASLRSAKADLERQVSRLESRRQALAGEIKVLEASKDNASKATADASSLDEIIRQLKVRKGVHGVDTLTTADGVIIGTYQLSPSSTPVTLKPKEIKTVSLTFDPYASAGVWVRPRSEWFLKVVPHNASTQLTLRPSGMALTGEPAGFEKKIFPASGSVQWTWTVEAGSDFVKAPVNLAIHLGYGKGDAVQYQKAQEPVIRTLDLSAPERKAWYELVREWFVPIAGVVGWITSGYQYVIRGRRPKDPPDTQISSEA